MVGHLNKFDLPFNFNFVTPYAINADPARSIPAPRTAEKRTLEQVTSDYLDAGFALKYQNSTHTPTGNTTFRFHTAGFSFKSTSYDWLVVAGKKAKYKGSGKINWRGDYGFLLSAIDDPDGDKFRLKVWDKETEEVVYDNQLGGDDAADPTTEILFGSIKVHKKK